PTTGSAISPKASAAGTQSRRGNPTPERLSSGRRSAVTSRMPLPTVTGSRGGEAGGRQRLLAQLAGPQRLELARHFAPRVRGAFPEAAAEGHRVTGRRSRRSPASSGPARRSPAAGTWPPVRAAG